MTTPSSILKSNIKAAYNLKNSNLTLWQKTINKLISSLRPGFSTIHSNMQPLLDYNSKRRVQNAVNIEDLRLAAEKRSHAMVFGYLDGGADSEIALRRSVSAYEDIELRHAILHGVSKENMDLSTNIMNIKSSMPFFLTSCAGQKMFHADGEIATAKAANNHNIPMTLSQLTTSTFEEVRNNAPNHCKALQLYVWKDKELLKDVLYRARNLGFTSLVLTADFSWVGNRERETRTGFTVPPNYSAKQCYDALKSPAWSFDYVSKEPYGYKAIPHADFPAETLVDFINEQMKPDFDWDDANWLINEWKNMGGEKCVLKGVASVEESKQALITGFDSLWVSNHGGRQLESSVPTIKVLPEIRDAVGKDVEIILDGGVRRGIDIIKGLISGADSVAIGRAYLYGLAAGGYDGIDKALNILKRDVSLGMGLLGCNNIQELKDKGPSIIVKV